MRLGGLGEGELVLDPHLESAALDPRQHLPRSCNELRAGGDVVGEGRARQKERAFLAQHLRVERRDRAARRSEEHTSELQSLTNLVCRLLLEKKKVSVAPSRSHR